VSEPPRTGEPVEIIWNGPFREVIRADASVEVLESVRGRLRLRITPGTACATHTCDLTLP
jgi:hyaluronate lyase